MKRHRRNKLNNLKNSVFLILLLGIARMTEAQMLSESHSMEWYYGFASHEIWASRYFYQHLVTAGDTTIMGKNCVIVKQADDSGDGFNATTFGYENMGKSTFFLHREPDKLLWFNEELGDFTTLHDYSLQPGDSWTIQVSNCSINMIVDSVDMVFFGGKNHRVLYIHDDVYQLNTESYSYPFYGGCIIEDVGHTEHFFPHEIYWLCNESFLCGTPEPLGIRCVLEDGEKFYHQGEIDCDSVYSISHIGLEEDLEFQDVMLYPNPVMNVLQVQFNNSLSEAFAYQIYDCHGICCVSGIIKGTNNIPADNLSKGFYILKLSAPSLRKNYLLKFVKY